MDQQKQNQQRQQYPPPRRWMPPLKRAPAAQATPPKPAPVEESSYIVKPDTYFERVASRHLNHDIAAGWAFFVESDSAAEEAPQ